MSLLKKLAGETAIYGVSSILSRLLHYVILTPFFTRIFLNDEYGVVSILFTYAGILMVFFTYRMETAFFRFGSKKGALDKTFSTATISLLATTVIFTSLVLLSLEPISNWLHYPDHQEYIALVAIIIAFDALVAIPFARLRLENRPIRFAILKTLHIVINIVFIFLFLKIMPESIENGNTFFEAFYDDDNKIQYVFISNLVASGIVMLLLLPQFFKIKLIFDKALWKKMLLYAMPLIIVGLAAVINQLIALPFLENLLSGTLDENRAQVGIYSAAAKLAVLMNLFTQAFNYAAEPFFFRNAERSDSRKIYAQVGQAFALVGALAFLGIMLYIDIVQLFLGKDFRGGLGVVPILLLAYFCLGLYYNFSIWYKLTDRTSFGAYISIGGVIITLSLNILLIPNPDFGYFAPAWAALACYGFMAAAGYWTGQKYYPIQYPIGKMLLYLGIAIGIYFLSLFLRDFLIDLSPNLFFAKKEILAMPFILFANTMLLLLFIANIYLLEKKQIDALLK